MSDLKKLTNDELKKKYYQYVNELHDLVMAERWSDYDSKLPEYEDVLIEMKNRGMER